MFSMHYLDIVLFPLNLQITNKSTFFTKIQPNTYCNNTLENTN